LLAEIEIIPVQQTDLQRALNLLHQMPDWNGTCEDAIIAQVAIERKVPLWTMNYRDLAAIREIEFWNPS
jgi:predicted nucleic acid-binding protein